MIELESASPEETERVAARSGGRARPRGRRDVRGSSAPARRPSSAAPAGRSASPARSRARRSRSATATPGTVARSRTSTSTASRGCPTRSGATSSRTSRTPSCSSSGRRPRAGYLPAESEARASELTASSAATARLAHARACSCSRLTPPPRWQRPRSSATARCSASAARPRGALLADVEALLASAGLDPDDDRRDRGRHRAGELHEPPHGPRDRPRAVARARRPCCRASRRSTRSRPERPERFRSSTPGGARSSRSRTGPASCGPPTSTSRPGRLCVGDGAVRYREVLEAAGASRAARRRRRAMSPGLATTRSRDGLRRGGARRADLPPRTRRRPRARGGRPMIELRRLTLADLGAIERSSGAHTRRRGRARCSRASSRSRRRSASAPSTRKRRIGSPAT